MSIRVQMVLGLLLAFSGCVQGSGAHGAGGVAAPVPPVGDPGAGGNEVRFEVDGRPFEFRTPEVRHSQSRVGDRLVAHSFELASDDKALYARLVLNVDEGAADLSGEYAAVSLGDPEQFARRQVGEVVLAEEVDPARGRRMLPSGSGRILVEHAAGRMRVRFETRGDGLFREEAAAPVTGTLDFHWQP